MSEWETVGKSDDWYTPKYIFDALDCKFDMDVAGPDPSCTHTHVPAGCVLHYHSLQQSWLGFVWMNPPFGGRNAIEPWLDKFFRHGNGIALTPDRTSAPWFRKYAPHANALLFISPKVKFERPNGTVGKSPGSGTALWALGERAFKALDKASDLGFCVLPV